MKQVLLVSKKLGSGFGSTSRLFLWGTFKSVVDHGKYYPKKPIFVNLNNRTYPFHFRRFSDFGLAYEILIENSYKLSLDPKNDSVDCIVDLGANSGISALYFRSLFPNSEIICFEPDPNSFHQLNTNAELLGNIKVYQTIVSNKIGEIDFHVDSFSSVSSSLEKRNRLQIPVKIKTKCLNSVVERIHKQINILKIYIEGSEEAVIEHFIMFDKIDKLIGEIHFDLCDGQKVLERIKSNFDLVEVYPVSDVRSYVIATHS